MRLDGDSRSARITEQGVEKLTRGDMCVDIGLYISVGSGVEKDVGCGENGEGGLLVVVVVVRIHTNAGSKAI